MWVFLDLNLKKKKTHFVHLEVCIFLESHLSTKCKHVWLKSNQDIIQILLKLSVQV